MCVSHAQGIKAQAVCFYDYGKCLKDGGPTPVTYAPEKRMPPTLAPTHGPLAVGITNHTSTVVLDSSFCSRLMFKS